MSDSNTDILTQIRNLLLLWDSLTDVVGMRIRPNAFHSSDGREPAIMLELIDGTQLNTLDRSCAMIDAELQITIRAATAIDAADIAEIVRTQNQSPSAGLDGYSGSAGNGELKSSERTAFTSGRELDDDGDETGLWVSIQTYQILFKLGG